jgi:hypothetical protein
MPLERAQEKKRREPECHGEGHCSRNGKGARRLNNRINRQCATDGWQRCNKRADAKKANQALISRGDAWRCRWRCDGAQHLPNKRRGGLLVHR